MPAFPIWTTVRAAWLDVWNNKKAALMVGWPVAVAMIVILALDLATRSPTASTADPTEALAQAFSSQNSLLSAITTPFSMCASVLVYGGWARFLARGHADWSLKGRGFRPVLLGQIKYLLIALGAFLLALGLGGGIFMMVRGLPGSREIVALMCALAVVAAALVAIRMSLLAPYCALTERTDLREVFALTHGHGWRILGLMIAAAILLVPIAIAWLLATFLVAGLIAGIVAVLGLLMVKIGALAAFPSLAIEIVAGVAGGALFSLYEVAAVLFICGMMTRVYLALVPTAQAPTPEPLGNPWHM